MDWLVVMRRLEEDATLESALRGGWLDPAQVDRVAARLGAFYAHAPRIQLDPGQYLAGWHKALVDNCRVLFNARLADPTDVGSAVSQGVSIISVNGVTITDTVSDDLEVSDSLAVPYLSVPRSLMESNPDDTNAPTDAAAARYRPSTLVPQPLPAGEVTPIISVSFSGSGPSTIFVPGYVAVPQGRIDISVQPTAGVQKSVQFLGAVLAAKITQTADVPDDLQAGLENLIVQQTFKLIAETTSW